MQRLFGGRLNRRDAIGAGMVGTMGMGLGGSPMAYSSPPGAACQADAKTGPTPPPEYQPTPEQVGMTQAFHLNFTESDGSSEVALRLASTLKKLGHSYPAEDISAIAHTITCGEYGETRFEDGTLMVMWRRPATGHLVVHVQLSIHRLVADLPANWLRNLFG